MSETNINAFKAELVLAESDLARAIARVEELKGYISAVEEPVTPVVVTEVKVVSKAKKGKK